MARRVSCACGKPLCQIEMQSIIVMMMIVMMIVMVIATVMVRWRSHHAPYAAHDATGYAAGHSANDSANRTGCTAPFRRTSFTAAYNALSPCAQRHRKKSEEASGHNQSGFHSKSPNSVKLTDISIDKVTPDTVSLRIRREPRRNLIRRREPRASISLNVRINDHSMRYRRSTPVASESTQIGQSSYERHTADLRPTAIAGRQSRGTHRGKVFRSHQCAPRRVQLRQQRVAFVL